jgi:hypothetical protein
VNFYQTKLGQQFFEHHVPRIVRALERIAEGMDTTELESKVALLELALNIPLGDVECRDGFQMSVGRDAAGYNVSFVSRWETRLEPYRDKTSNDTALSYVGVPELLLAQVIVHHGGLA